LVVGYAAAKSRKLERVILPAIDILQSIPPLGFMPGLVLALITLFPKTNTGFRADRHYHDFYRSGLEHDLFILFVHQISSERLQRGQYDHGSDVVAKAY